MNPATPTNALRAESLTVRYHAHLPTIISGQDVALTPGRITALVGPNGSGKSTLLKALGRQIRPEVGRVTLDGADVAHLAPRALAKRLGLLFQDNAGPEGLTTESLAFHGRHPHRRLFEDLTPQDHAAVEDAIRRTGVHGWRHRPLGELSGGQRQLAWLTMVLAQAPDVLLLDEPTTYLDLRHQLDVMRVVVSLRDELGITIAMVVHDVNHAARFADDVIAMRDGNIVARGSVEDVLTPDILRAVFDVEVECIVLSDGTRVCVPVR